MMVILELVYINILCQIFAMLIVRQRFFTKIYAFINYHHFIDYNSHYFNSVAMVSKHHRNYLKVTQKAFIILFQKRRSEASLFPTLYQCQIDDNKLSTTNMTNTKDDSQTRFQNESANEIDSDLEEKSNNEDDENLKGKHPKTEKNASPKVLKQELKQSKEGEHNLHEGYKVGSKLFKKKKRKSAYELEKKDLKSYNIRVL